MKDNFDNVTNYPLYWPHGIARTPAHLRARAKFHTRDRFGGSSIRKRSIAECLRELEDEVRRAGGRNLIVSSNLRVKTDGLPYSSQRQPEDVGVAVWFERKGLHPAFPCDKWNLVADNLWAIVCHIGLRDQQRWGVGTADQAFAGYQALPDPSNRNWWEVLAVNSDADAETIKNQWRKLSMAYHPDTGTNPDPVLFDQVQKAYKAATGRV